MTGNCHVRFLGGKAVVTPLTQPITLQLKIYGTGQMVLRSVAFTLAAATGGRVSAAQPRK